MSVTWHIIEGEKGCIFAREAGCVAVIVDALRASATAAMLLDVGATELLLVRDVEDAFAAKDTWPDALLFGERDSVPPKGFDYGNSPGEVAAAKGRRVIFTTTTGTARVLQAYGASAVLMGSTINALAVVMHASGYGKDVVVVPAGHADDPDFDAQDDWAAATAIAQLADARIGEGAAWYREWKHRLELDGVHRLFETSRHGEELIARGFYEDVVFCARMNVTTAVPKVTGKDRFGVLMRDTVSI